MPIKFLNRHRMKQKASRSSKIGFIPIYSEVSEKKLIKKHCIEDFEVVKKIRKGSFGSIKLVRLASDIQQ